MSAITANETIKLIQFDGTKDEIKWRVWDSNKARAIDMIKEWVKCLDTSNPPSGLYMNNPGDDVEKKIMKSDNGANMCLTLACYVMLCYVMLYKFIGLLENGMSLYKGNQYNFPRH